MTANERLREQGFVIHRGVFSPVEIAMARAAVDALRDQTRLCSGLGEHDFNMATRVPELAWLYAHPRLVAAIRETLDQQEIMFTLHSDLAINRLSAWHKDSDAYFGGTEIGDEGVQVVKAAVYLQDMQPPACLSVQPGSHKQASLAHDSPQALRLAAGDVCVFDLRLSHSGQPIDRVEGWLLTLARHLGYPRFHPRAFSRIKDVYWRLRRRPDRYAMFLTYGVRNRRTLEFAVNTLDRQDDQLRAVGRGPDPRHVPSQLRLALESLDVAVYDEASASQPPAEARG